MVETLVPLLDGLAEYGERPALRYRTAFRTFQWSYRDLADAVRRFRGWYVSRCLAPGDRVVIWAPTNPDWVIAFFAAILNGLVAVPLDLHSSPEFVRQVTRETEARLVLRGRYQADLGPTGSSFEIGRAVWESARQAEMALPSLRLTPDDPVEIVYTSGTTSAPRGVVLTHRNLASNLVAIQPIVPLEPFYRFLSLLPLSHVFEQVIDLLLPLSRGGAIVYLESIKPSAMLEAFRQERPNVVVAVPGLLELLRARVERQLPPAVARTLRVLTPILLRTPRPFRRAVFSLARRQFGGDLKYLVVGGAPLDRELERFWDALGLLVLQGYGLTEAGPVVAANTPRAHRIGSVGRPVHGVEVRLGRDGEVLVKGPGITPGYYRRPELNATAFIDGFFRTGDIGSFDRQGFLYLRGRLKDMIVTSAGLNVYPEDVENVLNRQPGVRDSVVLEWRGQVFAVLLLDPLVAEAPEAIVAAANRSLNSAQRITGWYLWPGTVFPRTPTLKVQKYKVREALASNVSAPAAVAPSASPVARIVQDLAPERQVAATSRLTWDLDLSSIDRLELITLLEEEFHVDLPEDQVTDDTTVAELEALVREGRQRPRWRPRRWPLSRLASGVRDWSQEHLIFPILWLILHPRVEGLENLAGLPAPFILAGNHVSHLDGPAILMVLPKAVRRDVAIAALAGFYFPPAENPLEKAFHWAIFDLASLFFNTFPVP
ncbi:MAG TPA: AMP-binding protein, partial [Chloroflexota bacterium]|nr:AMP-binding protein [Chloroflexota bacterium]